MRALVMPAACLAMIGASLLFDYTSQWAAIARNKGKGGRWQFLIWVAWVIICMIVIATLAYADRPADYTHRVNDSHGTVVGYVHAGPGHPIHPRAERLHG